MTRATLGAHMTVRCLPLWSCTDSCIELRIGGRLQSMNVITMRVKFGPNLPRLQTEHPGAHAHLASR